MDNEDFTLEFTVAQAPDAVFAAINDVRGWWSRGLQGVTDRVGGRFVHRVQDLHRCEVEVDVLVPGERVEWTVVDNHFSFTRDTSEWTGTRIVFELAAGDAGTTLKFTHVGLVPGYECHAVCVDGWRNYLGSLRELIETGQGRPNEGAPMTETERSIDG